MTTTKPTTEELARELEDFAEFCELEGWRTTAEQLVRPAAARLRELEREVDDLFRRLSDEHA